MARLLIEVEKYARSLLDEEVIRTRPFHNLKHTLHVVSICDKVASFYNLPPEERNALLTAAWFHDLGYHKGNAEHEQESRRMATAFLLAFGLPAEFCHTVEQIILATRLPSNPTSLLQEILCDADLHHLAAADYPVWSALLHREMQLLSGEPISRETWTAKNISFFKTHHYFTGYAKTHWENPKQMNLLALVRQGYR